MPFYLHWGVVFISGRDYVCDAGLWEKLNSDIFCSSCVPAWVEYDKYKLNAYISVQKLQVLEVDWFGSANSTEINSNGVAGMSWSLMRICTGVANYFWVAHNSSPQLMSCRISRCYYPYFRFQTAGWCQAAIFIRHYESLHRVIGQIIGRSWCLSLSLPPPREEWRSFADWIGCKANFYNFLELWLAFFWIGLLWQTQPTINYVYTDNLWVL